MNSSTPPARSGAVRLPGWDALVVVLLVVAVLQVTGLAEQAALPNLLQDVLHHPVLGRLLPAAGMAAMGDVNPRPGEPIGLVLNALTLGLALLYLLADLALPLRRQPPWKALLLAGIIVTAVFLPTGELILLRHANGPASYTHDGGVIQTEATIQYLAAGKNPYTEDYVHTPMADWGFSRFRTALYHYPYLPWTFLFSAPFYWLGQAAGFYDQRFVYLFLLALALALAPRLAANWRARLALVAILGLNPMMALDVIFGQNDSFVLCWLIFSLVAWSYWRARPPERRGWLALSAACFGLACASKPTAWFFAPFYALLLVADDPALAGGWRAVGRAAPAMLRRAVPAVVVFLLVVLPYVLWDPASFYDDIFRWSSGQGPTGYQIWGWGASNFVLAAGLVADRFGQWPFWLTELLVGAPLLVWFVRRQSRTNTLGAACWHYGVWLLAFFYVSRFLNENYLGFILAFLAIGVLSTVPASYTGRAGADAA